MTEGIYNFWNIIRGQKEGWQGRSKSSVDANLSKINKVFLNYIIKVNKDHPNRQQKSDI